MKKEGSRSVRKAKKLASASPPKPVKPTWQEREIKTDVDRVVELVGASPKDRLSLRKISKQLRIPYDVVEKWARILDENNVLELVYPKNPFVSAYLKVRKAEYAEKVDRNGLLKKKVEGRGKKEEKTKPERGSESSQERSGKKNKPGGREAQRNIRKRVREERAKNPAKTGRKERAKR